VNPLHIAMLSIHSSPLGELGKRNNGGMSVYIIELAAELEKLGHKIDIFTLRRQNRLKQTISMGQRTRLVHLDIGDCKNITKPALYNRLEDFFAELDQFRRREKIVYDLVHSHYWLSGQVGEWAQARWRVPHAVTFHSLGMVKKRLLNVSREPDVRIDVEKHLSRSSDCIVIPTRREMQNMLTYYDAPRDRMALIPCGVNLGRFRPTGKEEARRQLNFPADAALLLYVGRFSSEKGLDRLLEAIPLIDPMFRPHLAIVGGDGAEDEATIKCREISRRLGLNEHITFAGRIPQEGLPMYYGAADLMVLPSLYESFGLVALESLACGTPVVSTPVGALEHVILGGKTGEVVSDPGPQALALGINRVLARAGRGDISPQAVRASVLNFDWANIAAAISQEYTRLVNKGLNGADKAHAAKCRAC